MKKLLLGLFAIINLASANAADIQIKEGTDYTILSGVSKLVPTKPGKINVTEFYSYTCIHCSVLEPLLDSWYATTKNVDLNRIQVVWENNYSGYAKINATAQLLNLSSTFNQKIFQATITDRQNLENPSQLQSFLNANKNLVDPKKFMSTYNSFTISTKPQEYSQYTQAYNVTATPTIIVDNKYVPTGAQPERLMQIVQALVDKAKKEHKIK